MGETRSWPIYQPIGDQAVLISYEERIDPLINKRVRFLSDALTQRGFPWVQDVIFSFRSLVVIYDLHMIHFSEVVEVVSQIEKGLHPSQTYRVEVYEIPTVYGGPHGPDLNRVAEFTGLSVKEVVETFSSTVFVIYFLGFLCAQPYLGGLPDCLQVPRLDSPRIHVPAGSVGIGGIQAGVITIGQPSGFNFIGRTFLSLYDPMKIPPSCLRAGDCILFPKISEDQIQEFKEKPPKMREKVVPS